MDNQPNTPISPVQYVQYEKKPIEIKAIDIAFAFVALLAGILLANLLQYAAGICMTVYCLAFAVGSLIYVKKKTGRTGISAWVGFALIAAYSLSFVIFDNDTLKGWGTLFICVAVPYWYFRMFNCRIDAIIDGLAGFDLIKAVFVIPFANFVKIFTAMYNGGKRKKESRTVGLILLGLAVALIPSIIVVALLRSDAAFSNMSDMIFSDAFDTLASYVIPVVVGIPVAMYLFGMIYGCSENSYNNVLNSEKCKTAAKKLHCLSTVAVCSAMTPLILIYILFFVSQASYFLSAFSNILPAGMTVAEYAKTGFFELCAVSCINAVVVFLLSLFGKRAENGQAALAARIYTSIYSLLTIALVVTALSKMAMYIDRFGLTLKRVYATWAMLLIAVCFILVIIRQFAPKFNLVKSCVATFAVLFFALSFCDIDARIAQYNVGMFKADPKAVLDVDMISNDLSASALPYLDEIYDAADDNLRAHIEYAYTGYANETSDDFYSTFRSFNIAKQKALATIDKRGLANINKTGLLLKISARDIYSISWSTYNSSGSTSRADEKPFEDGEYVFIDLPVGDDIEYTLSFQDENGEKTFAEAYLTDISKGSTIVQYVFGDKNGYSINEG